MISWKLSINSGAFSKEIIEFEKKHSKKSGKSSSNEEKILTKEELSNIK